jgi:hypothetical protein
MSKIFLRHTLTKKKISLLYLYTFSLYENASLIIISAETEYISTRYRSLAQGEQFISYIMVRMNKFFYETMMVSVLS